MKVLFVACTSCGAPSPSPFGLCAECEVRQAGVRARSAKRRIREQTKIKRAA